MKTVEHPIIRDALNSLILSNPFFACLLLQQEFVESTKIKTMAVNGRQLFYNREFADLLKLDPCKAVLVHEGEHLMLLHHVRMGNRDPQLSNKAMDYAINPAIEDSGFILPRNLRNTKDEVVFSGPLLDRAYVNKSFEDIYAILKQKEQEDKKNGKNNQPGNPQPGNGNGTPQYDPSDLGEVIAADNPEQAEEETKVQINKAENFARACGKLPDHLVRELNNIKKSRHDWRELLNRFLTEICAKDYSFNRPNKRFISSGFVLPTLYSKTMGKFILAIDTSGSISLEQVSIMVSEVLFCLEMLLEDKDNIELTVIYCDSVVQNVEVLTSTDDKPLPKGGGGTKFSPVFDYVEKEGLDCAALIYLTDGYTSDFWNDKTPDYPVLFGLICDNSSFNPPFGETFKFDIYS